MVISLEDLKKREYSESFDELLAKAKVFARDREEELEILTNWVVYDLSCRKIIRKIKRPMNVDPEEKTENRRDKYGVVLKKMKASYPKPQSVIRKDQMTCNVEEDKEVSDPSSAGNDHHMKRKQSTYASCSQSTEDQDECFHKHEERMTPNDKEAAASSSSARNHQTKRKRRSTEDQAGDMMDLMMKKKAKRQRALQIILGPPLELPMEFRNKIESLHGSEPKLVIQKVIQETDLSDHHDRLNLPKNQVRTDAFLPEQDQRIFDVTRVLDVRVILPCLEEFNLRFRKWRSSTGYSYALNSGWKNVVSERRNNIRSGNIIQVWSFRVDDRGENWFALVCHDPTNL